MGGNGRNKKEIHSHRGQTASFTLFPEADLASTEGTLKDTRKCPPFLLHYLLSNVLLRKQPPPTLSPGISAESQSLKAHLPPPFFFFFLIFSTALIFVTKQPLEKPRNNMLPQQSF